MESQYRWVQAGDGTRMRQHAVANCEVGKKLRIMELLKSGGRGRVRRVLYGREGVEARVSEGL